MKKSFILVLLLIIAFIFTNPLSAQKYVSTQPSKKNAILELYTGVRDSYSPKGNAVAYNITNKYAGKSFLVSYHTSNSSKTTPYGSDEDMKRTWPATFYEPAFAGLIDMPVSFVNRRLVNGKRALPRDSWQGNALEITKEASPCNVGFLGTYDKETKLLTLDIELYFTAEVTDNCFLYVVLMQDSILAMQSTPEEYEPNYVHNKVFREALTDVWGDPITESTGEGSLITKQYTFDNSINNYKMEKCSVLVFVRNGANEEIITGWGSKAHSDRLTLPVLHSYAAIDTNDSKSHTFNIKNISEETASLQLSVSKSKRTPSDWFVEYKTPGMIQKKSDSPQDGIISIDAGDSAEVTVTIKTRGTTGAGDAILNITATNLYNETKSVQFTALSTSYEKLEILESPTDIEPGSLNSIIKTTGRNEFFKFESKGIGHIYKDMTNLKVVSWSFNPCDTLTEEYANSIYNLMKKGISVLITGCVPFTTLYDLYAGHPLINYLGVTLDEQNSPLEEVSFIILGESKDEDFYDVNMQLKINDKTDSLIQPLKINKPAITTPIIKIGGDNNIIGTKSQTAEARAIVLHFNPYSITTSGNRSKIIDRSLDWLEAPYAAGPDIVFNSNELQFGELTAGKYKNLDLEITNSGESTLELSNLNFSGTDIDNFNIYSGGITGIKKLAPGAKHTTVVRFTVPANIKQTKDFTAALEISTNVNKDSVFKVPLFGRGLGPDGVDEIKTGLLNISVVPNPVGSQSVISFVLNGSNAAHVGASLIDASGRTARTIYNDIMQPGTLNHQLNTAGLASGTYFLVVKSIYGNYNIQVVINK